MCCSVTVTQLPLVQHSINQCSQRAILSSQDHYFVVSVYPSILALSHSPNLSVSHPLLAWLLEDDGHAEEIVQWTGGWSFYPVIQE